MRENIVAGASACAVVVSLFSTLVSCSSQRDIEDIKQSYVVCNTKIKNLSDILQFGFKELDSSMINITTILYNPNGKQQKLPTDPDLLRELARNIATASNASDQIWRQARPFLTGERQDHFSKVYNAKFLAFLDLQDANNKGISDPSLGDKTLLALNTFIMKSPLFISDELKETIDTGRCDSIDS